MKNFPRMAWYTFSQQHQSAPRFRGHLWWLGLGLLTFFFRWVFGLNPYFTEVVYSRGIFLLLRWTWDYTLGWLPLAWIYLAIPLLLGIGIRYLWRRLPYWRQYSWRHRVGRLVLRLLSLGGGVYTLFYFCWGYNYLRRPVEAQLGIAPVAVSSAGLAEAFERATTELLKARQALSSPSDQALRSADLPPNLESVVRQALTDTLSALAYPTPGRVRTRRILPPGSLMQLGASGIYIPFIFEGHYDGALPPVLWPEVMAHEMAHGYGFGDEGTCNFWAVLACTGSPDPAIRYSGYLGYWIEVARAFRRMDREAYAQRRAALPAGILADLAAINQAYQRYPGFFPQFYDQVYDNYLKNQGIEEGLLSYGRVIELRMGWEEKNGQ